MWRAWQAELSRRWFGPERLTVADLLQDHPELAEDAQGLAQLVLSEVALRTASGEKPPLADYAARYPQCAAWFGDYFRAIPPATNDSVNSAVEPGTMVAGPGVSPLVSDSGSVLPYDEGSIVASPSMLAAAAASSAASPVASAAVAPDVPPPAAPVRLLDLYANLSVGDGSMVARLPAGIPLAAAPAAANAAPAGDESKGSDVSFDTVQSMVDVKKMTAIIERAAIPQLKIPGYELLGELGRGGMGVVYRARQLSADRIVALKVIRNDVLDTMPDDTRSSTVERFRHEAQAAAKIEHDHLVSVYEVGECDGLKYYAMRFVEGKSLYELLRDGPLANERAARYLEPVCRAIHAIHEHGILHRDLKPHNIMIDRRGDRPLVTDFGLAKFVDGQNELTHAGTVMGTPSYMSPEQAVDSAKVTALADVYSLGATLYHCLAGRAPFQAAHVADTLRQIMNDDPIAPRKLNPAIDVDLETICLKSLHKEPAKRYATAAALADDLARYLRREPILARPVGQVERIWRWCRRNELVASLIGTAAVLAVVAIVAVLVGYYETKLALRESRASLRKALAVVDEFCTTVAEEDLKNLPGFQPLRKDLLERAQQYYTAFLAEGRDDPMLRDELGRANFRMGVIQDELGDRPAAVASLEAALEMQRAQLKLSPQQRERRQACGDTLNYLGTRYQRLRRFEEAAEVLQQAQELRADLAAEFPDAAELQRALANTIMNQGLLDWARGNQQNDLESLASARRFIEEAQRRRQEFLPRAGDKRRAVERDLAQGDYSLAQVQFMEWSMRSSGEAQAATDAKMLETLQHEIDRQLDQARARFQKLIDESPELLDRYRLAICLRTQGESRFHQERDADALTSYEAAQQVIEALARENPTVPLYQREEAELQIRVADLRIARKENDKALVACQRANVILTKLRELHPEDATLESLAADVENLQASLAPNEPQ